MLTGWDSGERRKKKELATVTATAKRLNTHRYEVISDSMPRGAQLALLLVLLLLLSAILISRCILFYMIFFLKTWRHQLQYFVKKQPKILCNKMIYFMKHHQRQLFPLEFISENYVFFFFQFIPHHHYLYHFYFFFTWRFFFILRSFSSTYIRDKCSFFFYVCMLQGLVYSELHIDPPGHLQGHVCQVCNTHKYIPGYLNCCITLFFFFSFVLFLFNISIFIFFIFIILHSLILVFVLMPFIDFNVSQYMTTCIY